MLIWGNLAAYLSDHRLATSGSKQTFVALVVNDCDADFSAGRRCSEIRFNTTSCFRTLTRQRSTFSRNLTFKGVKQAEIQTCHSLHLRPMSHMRTKQT